MNDIQRNNKIAKNTLFLYIRLAFILLVSLYTTRVVLNVLGVVDYGVYNVVAGFVSLFSFLNASMSTSTQRFYNYKKGAEGNAGMQEVFNTSLTIQIIIMLGTLILLESFGLWYINCQMVIPADRLTAANWLFQFSVIHLLFVIMQIPFAGAVIACEKMNYYALVGVVEVVLKLAVVLVLPYVDVDKLVFYGSFMMFSGIVVFLMYVVFSRIKFDFICLRFSYNRVLFKEMLAFTGWTVFDSVAYILKGQGINVLLNAFCGPVVNAARGVAYQISNALSGFQANVITAFKPQLIQSYAERNQQRVKALMYSSSKISYVLLGAFSTPIIVEINYILNLWLKGVVPDYTIPFTIIVLINMTISSLNTPLSITVQATGKIRNYQIIRNLFTLCVVPISWGAMKIGADPIVVFIISFIFTLIVHPVSMVLLHKVFSYSYRDYCWKVLWPCFLFTILAPIAPFVIKSFMAEGVVRLVVITFMSVILSVFISYYIVFDKSEKRIVNKWLSNFMSKIKK